MSVSASVNRPLLTFVEGYHDIGFLLRMAEVLRDEPGVPDLAEYERLGRVIFVPTGGEWRRWACRFAPLGLPEFHLHDREVPPVTEERQQIVEMIRQRPGCTALLTSKRAVENYLHSDAIFEATGLTVAVEDDNDVVTELAAKVVMATGQAWETMLRRSQKRTRNRVKRMLTTTAVECMTPERLRERDPAGEVIGWLRTIGQMVGQGPW